MAFLPCNPVCNCAHCVHEPAACSASEWRVAFTKFTPGPVTQVSYLLNIDVDALNYSPLIGAETMNLYTSCMRLRNDGLSFTLTSQLGALPLDFTVQFVMNPTNPSDVFLTG